MLTELNVVGDVFLSGPVTTVSRKNKRFALGNSWKLTQSTFPQSENVTCLLFRQEVIIASWILTITDRHSAFNVGIMMFL